MASFISDLKIADDVFICSKAKHKCLETIKYLLRVFTQFGNSEKYFPKQTEVPSDFPMHTLGIWGVPAPQLCILCNLISETIGHLFFNCPYSRHILLACPETTDLYSYCMDYGRIWICVYHMGETSDWRMWSWFRIRALKRARRIQSDGFYPDLARPDLNKN